MPHHETMSVAGHVVDVFAHRFTLKGENGTLHLVDLGPKGVEAFPLEPGRAVVLEGERKPSEIKVIRIAHTGEEPVAIAHAKTLHAADAPAEPRVALMAVQGAGLEPIGAPRRKPKHFEVLARRGDGFVECHVALDGHIRKEKPVAPDDHKWSDAIATAV